MTTQEQVKSETSPVSTHPRSVNLTSPMLRTKSLCYRVLVPETCTYVAILHANTKTKTCTPTKSLHAPIQDISTISKNKASVLHRNLDASPPRFPVKNREHGGGYGASRNWIKAQNCSTAGPAQAKESEQIKSLKFVDIRFFQVQQQRNAISGTFTRDSI